MKEASLILLICDLYPKYNAYGMDLLGHSRVTFPGCSFLQIPFAQRAPTRLSPLLPGYGADTATAPARSCRPAPLALLSAERRLRSGGEQGGGGCGEGERGAGRCACAGAAGWWRLCACAAAGAVARAGSEGGRVRARSEGRGRWKQRDSPLASPGRRAEAPPPPRGGEHRSVP